MSTFAVAQPLTIEGGADAGAQDHLVEGLWKIVLRPELDAARNAVDLAHGRDHDHRNVPQPLVGLEPGQGLDAIQDRHHDIEQDEVEGLGREQIQRLCTIRSDGKVPVSFALEPLGQRVAIVVVVIDDENACIGV